MKILEEYMPYTSLSSVVKKIPDECSVTANDLGLNSKAAIFLQKACLSAMSKISKQNFIRNFKKNHPILMAKMQKAYDEMLKSFSESQETLTGQRFCVLYDEDTLEICSKEKGGISKQARISYFSDFIFMQ